MAALGGLGSFSNLGNLGGGLGQGGNSMLGGNMGGGGGNLSMGSMGGGGGHKGGGHVTLRLLISREEAGYLFGADEALVGLLRQQTGASVRCCKYFSTFKYFYVEAT